MKTTSQGLFLLALILIRCYTIPLTSAQTSLSSFRVEDMVAAGSLIEPLFSWTIISPPEHKTAQISYQILLSGPLPGSKGCWWNSGTVFTDQTQLIKYTGLQLIPNTRYTWSVNVSTSAGSALASSEFVTNSLTAGGLDYGLPPRKRDVSPQLPELKGSFQSAPWIWTAEENSDFEAPLGDRAFRYYFDVPTAETALFAFVLLVADSHFSLYVNGKLVGTDKGQGWGLAHWYNITLPPNLKQLVFAINGTNVGDSVKPAGILAAAQITFATGTSMFLQSSSNWRSSLVVPEGFQSPSFDDASWSAAKVLGTYGQGPWSDTVHLPSDPPLEFILSGDTPITTPTTSSFPLTPLTSSPASPNSTPPLPNPVPSPDPSITRTRTGQNLGIIIGGVLEGTCLVALMLALARYLWYRRKRYIQVTQPVVHEPFNLKYVDTNSAQNVSQDFPPPSGRFASTTVPQPTAPAAAEWNHRRRNFIRQTNENVGIITRVRLRIMEEQLSALNREISSGSNDGAETARLRARVAELREQYDNATLVGENGPQAV